MKRRVTSNTLLSLGLFALASPALAEAAAGSTPPGPGDAAGQIAEVVVTATRRAAPLQSVPISVGVVSADQYKLSNLKGVRDLQYLSPSVYVTTANGASIAIRGVGTTSTNNGGEQAVGLVVDGVVIGFIDDLALDSLPDLDHVEVLRGPQGELFGKNASAGVISITTKSPTFGAFYGTAHGSYGELNDTNDNITLNIPINDTLAARFTAYFVSRDGFVKDVALNRTVGGANSGGFQSKLLWKPNDKFDLLLNGDFRNALQEYNFLATWKTSGMATRIMTRAAWDSRPWGIVAGPDNIENADFESGHRLTRSGGLSAQANYHLSNGITLTSVTAERLLGRDVNAAIVSGAIPFENQHLTYNGQQFSQELRVTSPSTDRITYVGGLFFYNRTADATSLVAGPLRRAGGGRLWSPARAFPMSAAGRTCTMSSKAPPPSAKPPIMSPIALKLVAGGRFTYDDTHASTHTDVFPGLFPPPGGIVRPSGSGSSNTTNFSYRVGPQYNITPGIMVYFTYSTGYQGTGDRHGLLERRSTGESRDREIL